jgi:hypothetical protein
LGFDGFDSRPGCPVECVGYDARASTHGAAELSELQNCAPTLLDLVLQRDFASVANELRDKSALDEEECFIDATFVMAMVDRKSEQQNAKKARKSR